MARTSYRRGSYTRGYGRVDRLGALRRRSAASRIQRAFRARKKHGTVARVSRNGRPNSSFTHHMAKKVVKRMFQGKDATTIGSGAVNNIITSNSINAAERAFSWTWNLQDLPSYSDYTNMFQFYRILSVRVIILPLQNTYNALEVSTAGNPIAIATASTTFTQNSTTAPYIIWAKDHVSDSAFASEQAAMSHDGSQLHCFNNGDELSIYLEPKNLDLIGVGGTEISVPAKRSSWIPCTAETVPHYGLRCYIANMSTGVQLKVMMEIKVAFKGLIN